MSIEPGSITGSPISTGANPLAQSLADLLRPWTDALNDLSTVATKNLQLCNDPQTGSLALFQDNCRTLVGDDTVTFQGLGAQAFGKVYLLNVDQSELINNKIQDFYDATHDLLVIIQSMNPQYELSQDGGIYWNAGPGLDPWSSALSEFLADPRHDNNYVLRTLMDGFLTNTAIDDLLKADRVDVVYTIQSGIIIGMNKIQKEIDTSYQTMLQKYKNQDHSSLVRDHVTAIQMLNGFANNMVKWLQTWADDLYKLAQIYLQKVNDAGTIQELTKPLPPRSTAPAIPDPIPGQSSGPDLQQPRDRTHNSYLSQVSDSGKASNTIYAKGYDGLSDLMDITLSIQDKLNEPKSSSLLINLLGGAASVAGIVAAFTPVLGEVAVASYGLADGIAAAVLGGAGTEANIAASQKDTTAFDAINQLHESLFDIRTNVSQMPKAVQDKLGFTLTEVDTYPFIMDPIQEGDTSGIITGHTDYSSIASAKFTLSYFTIDGET